MRSTIRSKLILFTVLPVILVYSALFVLGVSHIESYLSANAQTLLTEHARHQASRLALQFSQVTALSESLGDLILAEPDRPQTLLYAHLIDGLRRTPIARLAAVSYGNPRRGALMERGAPSGRPLSTDEEKEPATGWQIDDDVLRFNRPITRQGKKFGNTWVELMIVDLYNELATQQKTSVTLFISDGNGLLQPPASMGEHIRRLAKDLPLSLDAEKVSVIQDSRDVEFWAINAALPDSPWRITAVTPTAAALAPVRKEVGMVAATLLGSLVVIVLIIGLVARHIMRPLKTLDISVRQISHGQFAVSPAVDSNDELGRLSTAIASMARQISDREAALHEAHQVLEQRVAERTAALRESNAQLTKQVEETRKTQRALEKANQEAQLANKAKSEFLSNMSHELRTPLHGVLGYTQILRRDHNLDTNQKESLEAIERCGQHLLTLINDILDLTRIEAGQMRLDIQPTDLPQLIADVELIMAQRARSKGVTLNTILDPDIPSQIMTDTVKLKQVLLNLVGNAIKFTDQGSIVLHLEPAENELVFTVSDTGVGIEPTQTDSIFDAFTQAREGQVTDGTGLGLTINQRLITLLGGHPLTVESTPGQGSRFSFRLPGVAATAELSYLEEQHDQTSGSPATSLPQGKYCHVMIIDPSEENRKMLAIMLGNTGCLVKTAKCTKDAEVELAQTAFDLVLLDVRLSDGDERTASTEIRRIAAGRPKLIALSANAFPDAAGLAQQSGFDAFLAKPFDANQLFNLLNALLQPAGEPETMSSIQAWPRALAEDTAKRMAIAIDMGDVSNLFQLAEELAENPSVPKVDADNIALMTRLFDFDGLRRFCTRLEQTN